MDNDNIPRLVWERDQARATHTIKVLVRLMILMLITLLATVGAFLWYIHEKDKEWLDFLNQYDIESYDYQQDGAGVNIIGDSNGVDYYGTEVESAENETQGR
jgi:flagellar basal body-associated protein FliL